MTGLGDVLSEVLRNHVIECTGLGEVTCRRCRDDGWMTWTAYRAHVAAEQVKALTEFSQRDETVERVAMSLHDSDVANLSWENESSGYHDVMREEMRIALAAFIGEVAE